MTPRPTAPRSAASSSASRRPRWCCATRGCSSSKPIPVFTRFHCKVFLTDALEYLTGAAATCMIDNTHVVVASGTGARMVPAPEMAAFAERFGFVFRAHEKGDANRSARVERPFHFIEHNFLAGRTFADLADLNAQARAFCDKVNATPKRHLHASPRELFAAERTAPAPAAALRARRCTRSIIASSMSRATSMCTATATRCPIC